ncbi:MAG: hypothetical protein C9356_13920 [Oleiphilus sp.]|nr:MAG: hypothetical protein C9356_13920 [Oleiphilus sp.]
MHYLKLALQNAQSGNHSIINQLGYCIGIEQNKVIHAVKKHPFWYVDIPRTSSSSIQSMLGERFGYPHGKALIPGKGLMPGLDSYLLPPHTPAFLARDLIGDTLWSTLDTFSIVRNPYTWSVSFWLFTKQHDTEKGDHPVGLRFDTFPNFLASFADKLQAPLESRLFYPSSFRQSDYLTDRQGKLIVKHRFRYEDRDSINGHLKNMGVQHISDEKLVKTESEAYVLNSDERRMVEEIFAKDFELLGY